MGLIWIKSFVILCAFTAAATTLKVCMVYLCCKSKFYLVEYCKPPLCTISGLENTFRRLLLAMFCETQVAADFSVAGQV
ncbi:hypothetical protein DFH08DRAFT_854080 [Mycena albidolilacea]|uniref:Secreted protein n=1 Tax=Mycena albidolilacea TaxID=1033008 RepID=A0AAD7AB00_9AGAR|nr:hypothetical protein DFH08DRAFT_854080 [Mycena albidolilacea]